MVGRFNNRLIRYEQEQIKFSQVDPAPRHLILSVTGRFKRESYIYKVYMLHY